MATTTLSGGGNIYNYSDERRKKYEQESDRALQELAQKRQALQNPRTYASQYAQAITDYVNRGKFSYDFNADPIYNQYKDQYTRQGNLAMKDTMGQAAALTGGYGNSYAQTAGQQVYNQYMQNLNDIVPRLYESAYSRYNQEGQDMLNRASLLGEADNAEYQKLLQDYSIAADELNTATSLERAYAGDALAREQFEYQKAQDEIANQLARAQVAAYSSGGSGSGSSGSGGSGDGEDGSGAKLYTFRREDPDNTGNMIFMGPDGKEVSVAKGVNPYTGTKNPDIKDGTFNNGYQPDNVGGKKLTPSGYTDVVNGRTQNVWFDSDGLGWTWDGTKNAYQAFYVKGKRFTRKTLDDKNTLGNTRGRIKEDRYM